MKIRNQARRRQPGPAVVRPCTREEHQRQEQLDIAQQVAGDDHLGGEPSAIARGDADAGQPLARRRPTRAQFEEQEVGIAEQEDHNDPDNDEKLQRLPGNRAGLRRPLYLRHAACNLEQSDGAGDDQHDNNQQIEHQRAHAGTPAGNGDR